jgi:DNA invertase Pin-like site-specific DNA recombinase
MNKTVGIYVRVSTSRQDVEVQLLELRRYCSARGWEALEYVDDGFSGSLNEDQRPALKNLMADARRRKIAAVVVWDYSRFARSLRQLVDALDSFRGWGVSFISLREGIDTETANGRLIFGIFASLAEFERELTRERILLGLKRARARGRVPGPKRNPVDLQRLAQEAAGGRSLRQLAVVFGVSKDTVRALLPRPAAAVGDPPLNPAPAPLGAGRALEAV